MKTSRQFIERLRLQGERKRKKREFDLLTFERKALTENATKETLERATYLVLDILEKDFGKLMKRDTRDDNFIDLMNERVRNFSEVEYDAWKNRRLQQISKQEGGS